MKDDLEKSANRHAERLLSDLREVIDIPKIAEDAIRREMGYATKDGYRITMRHLSNTSATETTNHATL